MTHRSPVVLTLVLLTLSLLHTGCQQSSAPAPREGEKPAAAPAEKTAGTEKSSAPKVPKDGREALELMAAAYRNASSYADNGKVHLMAEQGEKKIDQTADFAVALVRPNKLRLQAYRGVLISDGNQWHGAVTDLPGNQVVQRKAPPKLTLRNVYFDNVLSGALTSGFAGGLPQPILLLGNDPLKALLEGADTPELSESGTIGEAACYRVKIRRPEGIAVFWIDQQTFVLRRMVFPTDELRQRISGGGDVQSLSLVADFDNAQLGGPVDAKAFAFEAPADAKFAKFLIAPTPAQLLSQKTPAFKLTDLDGKPVTPDSLAGKIAVLDFWATWCPPCRESLPNLEKVYQQFKDNKKVAFLAVSVDEPQTEAAKLRAVFEELKVTVPIAREPNAGAVFNFDGVPTMFILGPDGIVQDYEVGFNPDLPKALPAKLEKLLAGENIYQKGLAEYQENLKQYEASVDAAAEDKGEAKPADAKSSEKGAVSEQPIPQTKIADRSQPATFKLAPLWKCSDVKSPGNILVFAGAGGPPRLLVIDAWKSVAEVGADGKLIASHKWAMQESEVISTLRTAATPDGKRYFAAVASAQQRLHLLDGDFKLLLSYPQDALENQHQGIADVELGDLDGDGKIKAYVGYWGVVGVQAVSTEGKLLWKNRLLSNVMQMALTGPDAQGKRDLLCTSAAGPMSVLDAKGERKAELNLPRRVHWIIGADLHRDGPRDWCGLSASKLGENMAVGLTLDGKEQWHYALPDGVQPQPIEPIVAGRVKADGPGQWLLPAPDGSIHIVAADGTPVDHFNYGAMLCGVATMEVDGKPVLVVSSSNGLEAWTIK